MKTEGQAAPWLLPVNMYRVCLLCRLTAEVEVEPSLGCSSQGYLPDKGGLMCGAVVAPDSDLLHGPHGPRAPE